MGSAPIGKGGWACPVGGFYARGCWRIQRLTTGWQWRCLYGAGLQHPHAGKSGKSHTLREAMLAVDEQEAHAPA